MIDTETGEITTRRLEHENGEARAFYVRAGVRRHQFRRFNGQQSMCFLKKEHTSARLRVVGTQLSTSFSDPMRLKPSDDLPGRQQEPEAWRTGRAWSRAGAIRSPGRVYRRC